MRIVRSTALTGALAVAALVGAGATPAVAASPTAHHRSAVSVRVIAKHKVQAPRHTQPGLVRVRNTGKRPVLILDPVASAGVPALVKGLNAANSGSVEFTRDFAVVDLLRPHTDAYLHLKRGLAYLVDAGANKYTAARVTTIRVKGARRDAIAPKSTRSTVLRAGTLTALPTKRLGKNAPLRVLNQSTYLEEVIVAPVGKKVSDAAVKQFLAHPSFEGLFKIDTAYVLKIVGVLSPHRSFVSALHGHAGRNLLIALPLSSNQDEPTLQPGQVRLLNLK